MMSLITILVKYWRWPFYDGSLCDVFLENNHFVAFTRLLLNSANDFGTFYSGGAYFDFAFHIGQEHAVELYGCSFFYLVAKIVNIQEAVFFCF